jgi:hypothetical protein
MNEEKQVYRGAERLCAEASGSGHASNRYVSKAGNREQTFYSGQLPKAVETLILCSHSLRAAATNSEPLSLWIYLGHPFATNNPDNISMIF